MAAHTASYPMTQLGNHAFNHSPSSDTEAEYDRLRSLARQEAGKRSSCFDRAHQAYESGNGSLAHQLSEEGHNHASQMDAYNRQASDHIFRANNATSRVAADTIDLHGQFVEEAERILEERIRYAKGTGQTHLHVIVGKGNHSRDHVQKLKPKVEEICREEGLAWRTEENEGRIWVDLTEQGGPMPPMGGGGGYASPQQGGGQYAGGQQHHGQQHGGQHQQQHQGGHGGQQHGGQHQGNNNEELEKLAKKFLPKILRKIQRGCCSVM